jgi:hypothetical protein
MGVDQRSLTCAECHRWQSGVCLISVFIGGAPIERLATDKTCEEYQEKIDIPDHLF